MYAASGQSSMSDGSHSIFRGWVYEWAFSTFIRLLDWLVSETQGLTYFFDPTQTIIGYTNDGSL